MPEPEIEKQDTESAVPNRRSRFNLRNLLIILAGSLALAVALLVVGLITYRYGVLDSWVKTQFTAKMADIGVVFSADEFTLTVAPLELHLVNATFDDRLSGEKLFFIRDARL